MSEIALYNLLKRIPDATDDEIEKAVEDVASNKEMATKSDIAELKTEMHSLNRSTIMWICGFIVVYSMLVISVIKYF